MITLSSESLDGNADSSSEQFGGDAFSIGKFEAEQATTIWKKIIDRILEGDEVAPEEMGALVLASELVARRYDGRYRYDCNTFLGIQEGSSFNDDYFATLLVDNNRRPSTERNMFMNLEGGAIEFSPGVVPSDPNSREAANLAFLTEDDVDAGYDAMFLYPVAYTAACGTLSIVFNPHVSGSEKPYEIKHITVDQA